MQSFLIGSAFGDTFIQGLKGAITSPIFIVFAILVLGYLVGRINIKGVSFGSAGVFIIALLVGAVMVLCYDKIGITWIKEEITNDVPIYKTGDGMNAIQNIGLAMFVAGVGLVAGPTFFRNFKKKAGSYIAISVVIVLVGTLLTILFIAVDPNLEAPEGTGLMMGAMTSTPGLTSAKEFFAYASERVTSACGVGYPFGVLGVVLFVQLMPRILRVDMNKEIEKLRLTIDSNVKVVDETFVGDAEMGLVKIKKDRIKLDPLGLCAFSFVIIFGILLGALSFRFTSSATFALGTTGGALIMGLVVGHFGHIGPISMEIPRTTLNPLRELGLVFFLAANGFSGGLNFTEVFMKNPLMLVYGVIITMVPMVAGFIVGRFVFKLELLNNLGSLTGGMTSTPALGALIHVSKTDEVTHSYAAAYPIALFLLVFAPMIIGLIFPYVPPVEEVVEGALGILGMLR